MGDLRMRDLCARTGLSRQAIHFYVEQGLVDPPEKTGRTMGYYTEAHVERILLVRKLKDEHFLPLKAIAAMLRGDVDGFSSAQRRVLSEVKAQVPKVASMDERAVVDVEVEPLLRRTKVERRDLTEIADRDLVTVVTRGKKRWLSREDASTIELWGEVRAAGFTRALGVGPELLALFDDGIERIFEAEKQILTRMTERLSTTRIAAMVDRALVLVHEFLVRTHERKVRALFAAVGASS